MAHSHEKTRFGGFFHGCAKWRLAFQNTPKSISSRMTVMGTPSNQAMMGMLISFEMGLYR